MSLSFISKSAIFIATIGLFGCSQLRVSDRPKNLNGWQTYVSQNLGFSIRYPQGFLGGGENMSDDGSYHLSFTRPEHIIGGGTWGVYVYPKKINGRDAFSIEGLIYRTGEQFRDDGPNGRTEARQKIMIDGHEALLATVSTALLNDWISKTVFFDLEHRIIAISNGASQSDDDAFDFEGFYRSFKFIN